MAEQRPGGGYRGNWKKWLWIYVVVGGIAYLIIYLVFIKNGGY